MPDVYGPSGDRLCVCGRRFGGNCAVSATLSFRELDPLLRTAAALSLFAFILCASTAIGQMQRDVLLQVVRTCVANHAVTGFAFPCLEVNTSDGEDRGYVVLRRPGLRDLILAPTKQVVGIEDPWLRTAEAPNYFQDAWNARHFLKELRQRPLAHDDVALAVNSGLSRAQDQLHIHIGCLARRARETISSIAPELSENGWVRIKGNARH